MKRIFGYLFGRFTTIVSPILTGPQAIKYEIIDGGKDGWCLESDIYHLGYSGVKFVYHYENGNKVILYYDTCHGVCYANRKFLDCTNRITKSDAIDLVDNHFSYPYWFEELKLLKLNLDNG